MGAQPLRRRRVPRFASGTKPSWVMALMRAWRVWAGSFGLDLVGGDTVGSRDLTLNVALLGEVERGGPSPAPAHRPGTS
jgi:thiamine monophosphate kinase